MAVQSVEGHSAEAAHLDGADSGVTAVAFDTSSLYLAVGGADARIYGVKQDWSVVKTFPDQPKKVCQERMTAFMGPVSVSLC